MFLNPIITADRFPLFHQLALGDIMVEGQMIPRIYVENINSDMTQLIDPSQISNIQTYEHRYVNANGVDVVIKGSYDDVTSVTDTLTANPPIKYPVNGSVVSLPKDIIKQKPRIQIGQIDKGDFIDIVSGSKIYSGSGIVLMVYDASKPEKGYKFIMFRDSKTKMYSETGGKIDKPHQSTPIDMDLLFNNASRETMEESINLFNIKSQTPHYLDIESTTDDTYYRVYLYLLNMPDFDKLPKLFEENKKYIYENPIMHFKDSYREVDNLILLDYDKFIEKLVKYGASAKIISRIIFQISLGEFVYVRGRTINTINSLNTNEILDKIITSGPINIVTLNPRMGTKIFNEIVI